MNVLPRETTAPWESDCRRCHERTLGAFDQAGAGLVLDAVPVYGGDLELRPLPVGFRAKPVEAAGDIERYVRHRCAKVPTETEKPPVPPEDMSMPFGKFRGKKLSEINSHYLNWCIDNADIRVPELRTAMAQVVRARRDAEANKGAA